VIAIFSLSLRALGSRRRLIVLGLLLAVPALVAIAFTLSKSDSDGLRFAVELFDNVLLPVLIPLTALIVGSSALGHEVEDRTLVYLTLRPVSRVAIVAAKYLAAFVIVIALVEVSVVATFLIASQKTVAGPVAALATQLDKGNALGALMLASLAGSAAYISLFLLLGLVLPQRGLLVGLAYVLAWEGVAAGVSSALATLSVRRYVQGVLDARLNSSTLAAIVPLSLSGVGGLLGIVVITAAGLVLTTWVLRRIQLP
jgi:ABC-2 type transport system permease protein